MEAYSKREDPKSHTLEGSVVASRILVTGASGLLGRKLARLALDKGHQVFGAYNSHPVDFGKPAKLDLTQPETVERVVNESKPEVLIHAGGLTDVDYCEISKDEATRVNSEGTENLLKASERLKLHFIYVSTDYVFDGQKGNYGEEDRPNPVNHYGYSKLKAEEHVRNYSDKWCITRTSVLFGWGREHRPNFATWVLSKLKAEEPVNVVTDQYASPTLNTNLAEMLLDVAEANITGIMHLAGATRVSRYDFAKGIAQLFDLDQNLIRAAESASINWVAKRPKDSSLTIHKASEMLRHSPLSLNDALHRFLKEANQ